MSIIKTAQTCIRCGAPLTGNKCEYCGTTYKSEGMTGSFNKSYVGEITVNGERIRCYISEVEIENMFDDMARDISGRVIPIASGRMRTFTLVEMG